MGKVTLGFSTTPIVGVAQAEEPRFQGWTIPNETKDVEAIVEDLAGRKHTSAADERRELSYLLAFMTDELAAGNALDFGGLKLGPVIRGSFPTADAPYDESVNSLAVGTRVYGELAMSVASLLPVNVNAPLKAVLYGVMDAATKENDLVTYGFCYLQGRGLAVNTSRADEGVWLVGQGSVGQDQETKRPEDPKTMYRAKVNSSDSQTVNCTFETLPPEGAYTLRLVTRGGGRADFAPVTLERRVTVKHIRPVPVKLESVLLTFSDGSTKVLTPEEAEALRRQQS